MVRKFERYYSRKWHKAKSETLKLAAGSTAFKYRVKLSTKGSWRVSATHSADSAHWGTASAKHSFKVK